MNTTIENNKIIAEFMELEKPKDEVFSHCYRSPIDKEYTGLLLFDVDWNWLMEVVQKIKIYYNGTKFLNDIQIRELINLIKKLDKEFTTWEIRIEDVYNACVEFIKWYNEQKSA